MNKKEIVNILNEVSIFYELTGANFFKIRAYRVAARSLDVSDIDLYPGIDLKGLTSIKGIGQSIAEQIKQMIKGDLPEIYEKLKASIPPGLIEMLKIPKLGPKKIKYLYDELGLSTVQELEYACIENQLLNLPGFGPRSQENILKGIELFKRYKERFLYSGAALEAEVLYNKIANFKSVKRSSLGGSIRRKRETVKDIDIVASTDSPKGVMDYFTGLKEAEEVIAKGDTKSSIRLLSGINADIRIVSDEQYPYALHHFTGSKEHNTAMRSIAKKMGIKMNEYGLFKEERLIRCKTEEDIFSVFGMDYIEPELRENTGEIEAAQNKSLPDLVTLEDIKGIFHFHTVSSDGTMMLEHAVAALKQMGFEYGGVADHSKTAWYAGGISEEKIPAYLAEIDLLNEKDPAFKIFKGIESDILPDGSLDYPDDVLERFDFVIIAIHSNFNMGEKQMTERIIKAMSNKYSTMLAHPTGRLLLARDPYNVDIKNIIDAAADLDVDLEINASPYRLDLDWQHCKYARDKGLKLFINPDAHSLEGLEEYRYGINIARKGWLEKKYIANTMARNEMEDYLKSKGSAKKK